MLIQNEQRLFQVEQQQRKLVESVKQDSKQPEESKTTTETGVLGETKTENEPIYPVLANYVLPELVNPIDHLENL